MPENLCWPTLSLTMGALVKKGELLLSRRQLELVQLLRLGLRNRDIAEKLGVTEGTVKSYLHAVFKKTGASNRTELALRASEWGAD